MDAIRKENMPPWRGGHLITGQRLVQKNVSISASAGNGCDTKMVSCWAKGKRSTPAILPGLGRPVVSSFGSRQPSPMVQTNLAPPGRPLQDATSLVSNSCFEQQNNLQPWPGRPRASGKWRRFSFQQSNMKLSREDPERRGGNRSPQSLEKPDWDLEHCSQEPLWPQRSRSVPWPSRSDSQSPGHSFLRDRPSSSFPGLGNTAQASPKAMKAQGSEPRSPPQSGLKDCPVQPCPRPRSTLGCWAPSPRPLTLDDLSPSNQRQRSAHSLVLGPRAELSLESARLFLSRKRSKWPMELPLLRPSREHLEKTVPPEAPSSMTPGHTSPLNYSCRTVPPEEAPNLTPGHTNPLTYSCRTMPPEASPNLTPGHHNHPCNPVPAEASANLKPGHPNPLTHPSRAVPPETSSNLTPGHSSPLTHPCRTVPQEAPPNLTPGHPRSLSHIYKAVSLEAPRNLITAHPRSLSHLYKAVPLEASPNLTSGYPNPLTHSSKAMPPEASINLTSGNSNPLIHPCRALPQEASPNLTPGHPSSFTHHYKTVPLDAPQNLTPRHPNPLTYPYKVVPPEALHNLTSGHPNPLIHSCRAAPPEASTNQTPGHPSPLTHPYKVVPLEASPGHPNPLTHPCRSMPPEVLNLTSGHPISLTYPYKVVPLEASPNLTPDHTNLLTHPCRVVPLEAPPNLTPGNPIHLTVPSSSGTLRYHSLFTLSHGALSSETYPKLSPRHPKTLSLFHKTMSTEDHSNLTPGYTSLHPHSNKAGSPETPPNLTLESPIPRLSSNRIESSEVPPILKTGNLSNLPQSRARGSEVQLTMKHCPLSCSISSKSPETSHKLTLGHLSPPTSSYCTLSPDLISGPPSTSPLSHSTLSPVISPDLPPEQPSIPTSSHSTLSPVISPDLTSEHSNPPTLSTLSPVISSDLTSEHSNPPTLSTLSPVISPDLTSEHSNPPTLSTLSPVISSDLTSEHSNPPTLSTLSPVISSDLTSEHSNPPTLSTLSPVISPDLPPSTSALSHKTMSPVISPDQTLGYPSPHTPPCKIITPEASPKLTPGSSSLHPHSNKTKVPEASTSMTQGYPSPLPLSHRDVTPETSPSLALGCPQGVQQFPRTSGISKTQGWSQEPDTKEGADSSLPSSGDGHSKTPPSSPPGTSENVFKAAKSASFSHPATAPYSGGTLPSAFPQAFCDKLSLPSGRGAALGNPQQAVPASPETSSLLMSRGQGQDLMETQLEGHLKQIWEIFLSLVPQGTETPTPDPKKGTLPTSSGSEGGTRQSLLKNVPPEPHLSGQERRLGSRAGFSAAASLGVQCPSQQQLEVALRATEHQGPRMEQGIGRSFAARNQNRSDQQLKLELRKKSSMEPLTPEHGESRVLLTRCFKAWQYYLLKKEIIAKVLRRRHLLRKGIRAMRWSLWLRKTQIEFMKRKQSHNGLAQSFQKWKNLYLNRKERKPLTKSRTEISEKELDPSQKGQQQRPFETLGLVYGVEGSPKIQLYPRWKLGNQDPRAPGTQDLQRLTVFHLWYLQKVLMAEIRKEAWARDKLGRKKLQRIFQAWLTRTKNMARICSLVTQHQRAQLGRCFGAWRCHTQRKSQCRNRLIHWRVEILRKSLQQWVKMMWLQATYSRIVTQLYLHRQTSWHLEVTTVQEGSSRELVSQGPRDQGQPGHHQGARGKDALEEACRKLKLHRVVLLWSRRLVQLQQADSFSRSRRLQLLQSILQRWRQMTQATESPPASSTTCPQEPLGGSQDSEEPSTSSGLLGVLVPGSSTPSSSSEGVKVYSPTDTNSSSLSLAGDDPPWVLPLSLKSLFSEAPMSWRTLRQKWPQLREWQQSGPWRLLLTCPPLGEETGVPRNAVQVPRDPGHLDTSWQETGWQQGAQQALEVKQHCQITLQTCVICSWNLCAADQGVWWELFCQQGVWGLIQEALHHWHTSWQRQQAFQELGHQWPQHWPHILKRIACGGWPRKVSKQRNAASCQEIHFQVSHHVVLTALNLWVSLWTLQAIQRRTHADLAEVINFWGQDWRTSGSRIYHIRQHRLLRSPWDHRGMMKYQLTKKQDTSVGQWTRNKAMHPWRLDIRGRHMLRVDLDTLGKQANNYWTRATALAQTKRKLHSLIGQEMLVSLGDPCLPIHCNSFQLWFQLNQKQSRVKGLTSQEGPRKAPRGEEEGSSKTIQILQSGNHKREAGVKEIWLERKYLQKWRHKILLQRFDGRQRRKRLAKVWQHWIETQGSEQLAKKLVRQWWLEWSWKTWRRRWLQLQVALYLQDNHSILSQVFRRWHQIWAARVFRTQHGVPLLTAHGVPPSGKKPNPAPILS